MSNILKVVLSVVVVVATGIGSVIYTVSQNRIAPLGSVAQSGEYNYLSTYTKLGVPAITGQVTSIKSNSSGTLGSIVITGAVAGALKFMDATSSTDVSSTTIVVIPASAAAGTYTLDTSFFRGLIMEGTPGLIPTSTITHR